MGGVPGLQYQLILSHHSKLMPCNAFNVNRIVFQSIDFYPEFMIFAGDLCIRLDDATQFQPRVQKMAVAVFPKNTINNKIERLTKTVCLFVIFYRCLFEDLRHDTSVFGTPDKI